VRFSWIALLLPAALLLGDQHAAEEAAPSAIRYVDRTEGSGITIRTMNGDPTRKYIIETLGSGSALFDYDNDGDLDLFVVNGSALEPIPADQRPFQTLYRNDGKGHFTDVSAAAGVRDFFWGFGVAAGDYDNDGDIDLYVTAWGPNRLYRNNSDGTFTEVARESGVDDDRFGTSAAFLDYDGDGALDLFVANYVTFDPAKIPVRGDPNSPCNFRGLVVMCGPHGLPGAVDILYHNNGDGTFTDVTAAAGLYMGGTYYGLGVTASDIDGDGRIDILVANDSTPNHLYRNQGGGRFVDDAIMSGFAYSNDGREQAGMGIDTGDVDGDGDLDVFVTNFSHDYSTLRQNDGSGFLEDISVRVGLAEPTLRSLGWGTMLVDMDNDGDLDIFIANGHVYPEVDKADIGTTYLQRCQIFENLGNLTFRELIPSPDPTQDGGLGRKAVHRGVAGGDIDGDGDIDLLVTVMNDRPRLLVNESNGGSWLTVRLVGRASNRDAVGARVTVRAGDRAWVSERRGGGSYLSASDPRVHFGFGGVNELTSLEVRWPSGRRQLVDHPPLNQFLTLVEPDAPESADDGAKSAPGKTESP
jgi:enediyne biosynthesis protein E4